MDVSRVCSHVIKPLELVNLPVRGIHEETREKIQEHVHRLHLKEQMSMVSICQLAAAEGLSQGALLNTFASISSRGSTPKKNKNPDR